MNNWVNDAVFYHIYPLGFCGCEQFAQDETTNRIKKLKEWIPHLKQMHINAVYLGPVFESFEHGYDTSDYRQIDRRLGSNADFRNVCDALHEAGIHIVLDGVFNHVGRNFWAFKDVQEKKEASPYCDWFQNINFSCSSPLNDPFTYDTWEGHFNLIKLNLHNEEVVQYLLDSIGIWMDDFGIDGLRLDAADCIDPAFFKRLKHYCKTKRPDFWLMGEIIHGDYNVWANEEMLDSVTNYECYKGLYSSHNELNYFEIAHSLNRQFAKGGIYQNLLLYSFVDNHDVNRLASVLKDERDLQNIYTILFTMPGIPSVYYGSEYGIKGTKHNGSDADIRPCLDLDELKSTIGDTLVHHLSSLAQIHQEQAALRYGSFESVCIRNEQFVFKRQYHDTNVYIACNVSEKQEDIMIPWNHHGAIDLLSKQTYPKDSRLILSMEPKSSYILVETAEEIDTQIEETEIKANTLERKEENTLGSLATPIQEKEEIQEVQVEQEETMEKVDYNKFIPKDEIPLGLYEHYKGNHYVVLYIAQHSETLEKMVVYRQLYKDGAVWVRPLTMFKETIERDGLQIPRFKYIGK